MECVSRAIQWNSKNYWWRANLNRVLHVLWQKDERDSVRNRWMDSTGSCRRFGKHSRQKLLSIELNWWEWWMKFRFSSKGLKEGITLFRQHIGKKCSLFQQFESQILYVHRSRFSKDWWILRSIAMTQKDNGMDWQDKLRMCIVYRSIQSWQDVSITGEEVLKNYCEQHALRRRWHTFIKMMMGLIRSAKDICVVFGICDDLGKVDEIYFERQRYTAKVVFLLQESRRVSIILRQYAADHLSSYASTGEGNFLANTSSFENVLECRLWKILMAEGNFWLFPNHENSCGSCRKSEGTYRQKNLLDCATLHITQKSRRSVKFFQTRLF